MTKNKPIFGHGVVIYYLTDAIYLDNINTFRIKTMLVNAMARAQFPVSACSQIMVACLRLVVSSGYSSVSYHFNKRHPP